jgi:PilZ domain.
MPSFHERRAHPRTPSNWQAFAYDGSRGIPVVVVDYAPGGCRIRAVRSRAVPDDVELHIVGQTALRKSKVVWRAGDEAGLMFVRDQVEPQPRVPVELD